MEKQTCYICREPIPIKGVYLCKEHTFEVKRKFEDNSPHLVKSPGFAYHCQICGEWENRVILNDPDWMFTCNVCMEDSVNIYIADIKLKINTELREEKSVLRWLEKWYEMNCNNYWEHGYGVTIETQDNPGWRIEIDLQDTCLSHIVQNNVRMNNSEKDWCFYEIANSKFTAACDPTKLELLLNKFREIVEENSK